MPKLCTTDFLLKSLMEKERKKREKESTRRAGRFRLVQLVTGPTLVWAILYY